MKEIYFGMDDQFGNWEFVYDLLVVHYLSLEDECEDGKD